LGASSLTALVTVVNDGVRVQIQIGWGSMSHDHECVVVYDAVHPTVFYVTSFHTNTDHYECEYLVTLYPCLQLGLYGAFCVIISKARFGSVYLPNQTRSHIPSVFFMISIEGVIKQLKLKEKGSMWKICCENDDVTLNKRLF